MSNFDIIKILKYLKTVVLDSIYSFIFFVFFFVLFLLKIIDSSFLEKIPYVCFVNKYTFLLLALICLLVFFVFIYYKKIKEDDGFCIEMLSNIEKYLHLKNWCNVSDSAVCNIISQELDDDISSFVDYIYRCYKPEYFRYKKFIKVIEILKNDFETYIETFHKCSFLRTGGSFCEDRSYKMYGYNPDKYYKIVEKHKIWQEQCFYRLYNCVSSLNELRKEAVNLFGINKVPLCFKNKFALTDSFGVTNLCKGISYSYVCEKKFVKELITIDDKFFNV